MTSRRFTPAEYLTLERSTDTKSEWLDGEIFAMGGGSPELNTIQSNLVEHWLRDPDGSWAVSRLHGLRSTLVIDSVRCSLALTDIYDRMDLGFTDQTTG